MEGCDVKTRTICQSPDFSEFLVQGGEGSTKGNKTVGLGTGTRASYPRVLPTGLSTELARDAPSVCFTQFRMRLPEGHCDKNTRTSEDDNAPPGRATEGTR